jgi:hypothetical protein
VATRDLHRKCLKKGIRQSSVSTILSHVSRTWLKSTNKKLKKSSFNVWMRESLFIKISLLMPLWIKLFSIASWYFLSLTFSVHKMLLKMHIKCYANFIECSKKEELTLCYPTKVLQKGWVYCRRVSLTGKWQSKRFQKGQWVQPVIAFCNKENRLTITICTFVSSIEKDFAIW